MIVKKYGNRRLYDTGDSRYITLEELATKIRGGTDVQVVDAKTGKDLTQATLTQLILESKNASRLLPVPLLNQMVRLGDDALSEFFGRYVTAAMELYLQARQNAQALTPYNPFASLPFGAADALSRLLSGTSWAGARPSAPQQTPPPQAPPPAAAPAPEPVDAMAELRREIEELKQSMKKRGKR